MLNFEQSLQQKLHFTSSTTQTKFKNYVNQELTKLKIYI